MDALTGKEWLPFGKLQISIGPFCHDCFIACPQYSPAMVSDGGRVALVPQPQSNSRIVAFSDIIVPPVAISIFEYYEDICFLENLAGINPVKG